MGNRRVRNTSLSTTALAAAFLIGETAAAQRVVRAKRTLSAAGAPFEVPRGDDLLARIPAVMQALYLMFGEGHAPATGTAVVNGVLVEEALRLARVLVGLVPDHAEAAGLLALMELTAARIPARTGPDGAPVLLADQDRSRWDRVLVQRGLATLDRAVALGRTPGPYALQAAISGCHARARSVAETDWASIVALYDALLACTGSPVVALNRAMAVSMVDGPAAALAVVDALVEEPALMRYPWVDSVRGDPLARLQRWTEAADALLRAAEATPSERDRQQLRRRASEVRARGATGR